MNSCIFLAIYGIYVQLALKGWCDVESVFITHRIIIIKWQVPTLPIVVIFSGDVCLSVCILILRQLLHIGKLFSTECFQLTHFSCGGDCEIICTLSYYYHKLGKEIWIVSHTHTHHRHTQNTVQKTIHTFLSSFTNRHNAHHSRHSPNTTHTHKHTTTPHPQK